MVLGANKTRAINVKWVIEIYPFESSVPQPGDFSGATAPAVIIGSDGAQQSVINLIHELQNSGQISPDQTISARGLKSVNINRNKAVPDGTCTFQMVGQLPKNIYSGVWAIVTSVSYAETGWEKRVIRFIGQVQSIESGYIVDSRGLFSSVHSIPLREWSTVLRAPVRYDIMSIQQALIQQGLPGAAAVAALGGASTQEIQEMVKNSYNPFEMAQLILKLVGAISQADMWSKVLATGDVQFPELAVTAPNVPPGVLARLGVLNSSSPTSNNAPPPGIDVPAFDAETQVPGSTSAPAAGPAAPDYLSNNNANPFQSGFVNVISGVQSDISIYNDGTWDGIFKDITVDNYKQQLKSNFESIRTKRPSAMGIGALMQPGFSAWDLLTSHCDPAIYEVFTDMLYEETEQGNIVAKPALIVRDKPYLLKKLILEGGKLVDRDLEGWTLYDALPRFKIPEECITTFRIGNTFLNSPNYIRVNYHAHGMDDKLAKAASMLAGLIRLEPEMRRFGGKEFFLETQFLGRDFSEPQTNEAGGNTAQPFYETWFQQLKGIAEGWHSYDYRMGNGVLHLKDDNFPISIGFNVQFNIGKYTLVGHVDSIGIQFAMDESGLEVTNTQVNLSRIVRVSAGNMLDYIPLEDFGSLPFSTPPAETTGPGTAVPQEPINLGVPTF
jgi:hypothetical protein